MSTETLPQNDAEQFIYNFILRNVPDGEDPPEFEEIKIQKEFPDIVRMLTEYANQFKQPYLPIVDEIRDVIQTIEWMQQNMSTTVHPTDAFNRPANAIQTLERLLEQTPTTVSSDENKDMGTLESFLVFLKSIHFNCHEGDVKNALGVCVEEAELRLNIHEPGAGTKI